MSSNRRTERVGTMIRDELMNVLLKDISDPRLVDIIFTEVEVSKDLHLAWVYYDSRDGAQLSDKKRAEIEKGLKSATPFFRRKVGQIMASKFTPELRFKQDTHSGQVTHLMQLIEQSQQSPAGEE
ncbi:MAG: 30S ribosome-binding factor RbfA [Proteobacteria bacterium]|nr:30S ribosome-binding factor RbfA [Pseudomonadota bacterium]NDC25424.1 30S ribosome-binding factor RbfA [Pseudomonadota bacterium]NDD05260.1 30S ribosome-binding factor RbfA [Pseudomonadota bacterium]NDG27351.1 30S ribosome-binding factor RbfA [Pseudomonadota bacterium]